MQYPFGVARMTYPLTVSPTHVPPVYSVAIPADLQGIPTSVSRPIRLGDLAASPDLFNPWATPQSSADEYFSDVAGGFARMSRIFQAAAQPAYAVATVPQPYAVNPLTGLPYAPTAGLGGSMGTWLLLGGGLLLVLMVAKR